MSHNRSHKTSFIKSFYLFLSIIKAAETILSGLSGNVTANISLANIKAASFNIYDSENIRVGVQLGITLYRLVSFFLNHFNVLLANSSSLQTLFDNDYSKKLSGSVYAAYVNINSLKAVNISRY